MPVPVVSVSGGKDSTATYTLAVQRGKPFRSTFADVGNEAEQTYDYIRELPGKVGGPEIEWVQADLSQKIINRARNLPEVWGRQGVSDAHIAEAIEYLKPTGNPFLDACLMHGIFPSSGRRFCTEELKIKPVTEQIYNPIVESGKGVIAWVGVRKDESQKRQHATRFERAKFDGTEIRIYRPLLDWSESDVFAFLAKHGIEPNPLYAAGAERVGCFPCIFARKSELKLIAKRFPEAVERIEAWEALVSKVNRLRTTTFFSAVDIPGLEEKLCYEQGLKEPKYIDIEEYDPALEETVTKRVRNPKWVSPVYDFRKHGIKLKVEWSKTTRGGRQYDLLHDAKADHQFKSSEECSMGGWCE